MQLQELLDKIQSLPPEKIAVVEDFVEFLRQRDDDLLLKAAAAKLAESSFQRIWDNADDADYDNLYNFRDIILDHFLSGQRGALQIAHQERIPPLLR